MHGPEHFHHVLGGFVGGKFGLEFFFFGSVHESWQDMVIKWLFGSKNASCEGISAGNSMVL